MFDLPLEYALIEFEGGEFSGKIVPELLELAQSQIVRFVDIVFIQKDEDGNTRTLELNDLDPETYEMFVPVGEHMDIPCSFTVPVLPEDSTLDMVLMAKKEGQLRFEESHPYYVMNLQAEGKAPDTIELGEGTIVPL